MTTNGDWRVYTGTGVRAAEPNARLVPSADLSRQEDPAGYLAEDGLRDAVNVALALSQPLLVTGDPGTGKTQLAFSVAYELGLGDPLVFHTTTTATARDLFYQYDALERFHDKTFGKESYGIDRYLTYQALGQAIILASKPEKLPAGVPARYRERVTQVNGNPGAAAGPLRSLVLIDEIDKAPRDLPNDVLHELENLEFTVREAEGYTFRAEREFRPCVILTSNSEKNLPDAFLRRCVFYHLTFPDTQRLRQIVATRLGRDGQIPTDMAAMVEQAIQQFERVRALLQLQKKPATAEFLNWVRVLRDLRIPLEQTTPAQADAYRLACSILGKNQDDAEKIRKLFEGQPGGA
jgi:MoxR-like ATPase